MYHQLLIPGMTSEKRVITRIEKLTYDNVWINIPLSFMWNDVHVSHCVQPERMYMVRTLYHLQCGIPHFEEKRVVSYKILV